MDGFGIASPAHSQPWLPTASIFAGELNKMTLEPFPVSSHVPSARSDIAHVWLDVTYQDFPQIADAFYIGGTKCGALFGEALVIVNDQLKPDMRFLIKQRGGMLAKGRLLGVQFEALLKDGLYLELGRHANRMAQMLVEGLSAKGYQFEIPPQTNLIFPMIPKDLEAKLSRQVMYETWPVVTPTHQCIRLVTSWGTTEEEIRAFRELI